MGGELGSGLLCNGLGVGLPSRGVAGSGFISGSRGASCLAGGGGGEVGEEGGRGKAGRQGAGLLEADEDEEGGTPGPADEDEGPPGEGAALEGPLASEPVLEVSLRPRARLRVSHTGPPVLLQRLKQGLVRLRICAQSILNFGKCVHIQIPFPHSVVFGPTGQAILTIQTGFSKRGTSSQLSGRYQERPSPRANQCRAASFMQLHSVNLVQVVIYTS